MAEDGECLICQQNFIQQTNRQEEALGKYINKVSQKQMSDKRNISSLVYVTRNYSAQIAEQENSVNANNHGGNTTSVKENEGFITVENRRS
ncbi:hypothetical protein HHI36_001359 [Cryptolaemus montrouzieri]|uniref:Uncharacterized protein n=1 Tax=Cryptolaemus montrouzieri TaxID=559131 RepID=A0ABD2P840_9CUCU